MVVQTVRDGSRVAAQWWAYDVASDRAHPLRDLPHGRCAPTTVSMWRERLAYAVECGSRSEGGVFLRENGRTVRVATARWSAGWTVSLTLRGDTLAASRILDDSIAAYRRGAELARYCQGRLANAEQEIRQLEGDLLKPLNLGELKGGTE